MSAAPLPRPRRETPGAAAIRHPAFARTRRYLAANPLPAQQDRRWSPDCDGTGRKPTP